MPAKGTIVAILLIRNDENYEPWIKAFQQNDPSLDVVTPQDGHDKEAVTMALTWKAPAGSFDGYGQLKVIGSLGAGVDHLFADASLPSHVQLTRVVDEKLSGDMQEFVLALCLNNIKNLHTYAGTGTSWQPLPYQRVADVTVGILGFGTLGQAVGQRLSSLGFTVSGWSTSLKNVEGITSYDTSQLDQFLAQSQILVCLLPLTDATSRILNQELFNKLPKGAYLINVARGGHLNETDLLAALDSGQLSGAALDVFDTEPLPVDHAYWQHPSILITPHVASVSNPASVVPQIIENYRRMNKDAALLNVVSRERNY